MVAKPIIVSQDIVPIGDLRSHAVPILRRLQETDRPVVITHNGKPAAVLLSPAEFDKLNNRAALMDDFGEGMDQLTAADTGRITVDGVLSDLDLP